MSSYSIPLDAKSFGCIKLREYLHKLVYTKDMTYLEHTEAGVHCMITVILPAPDQVVPCIEYEYSTSVNQ